MEDDCKGRFVFDPNVFTARPLACGISISHTVDCTHKYRVSADGAWFRQVFAKGRGASELSLHIRCTTYHRNEKIIHCHRTSPARPHFATRHISDSTIRATSFFHELCHAMLDVMHPQPPKPGHKGGSSARFMGGETHHPVLRGASSFFCERSSSLRCAPPPGCRVCRQACGYKEARRGDS